MKNNILILGQMKGKKCFGKTFLLDKLTSELNLNNENDLYLTTFGIEDKHNFRGFIPVYKVIGIDDIYELTDLKKVVYQIQKLQLIRSTKFFITCDLHKSEIPAHVLNFFQVMEVNYEK
jgi:hypothetical protein